MKFNLKLYSKEKWKVRQIIYTQNKQTQIFEYN